MQILLKKRTFGSQLRQKCNLKFLFSFVQARVISIYLQKIFGFLISDESVMSFPDYAERTFF